MLSNEAKKRYKAFWDRTAYERCVLFISERIGKGVVMQGASPEDKWTDLERRTRDAQESYVNFKYYAEGFSTVFTNFGPGSMAACIGGDFELAPSTIWFDRNPIIKDWSEVPELKLYEDSLMWQLMTGLTEMLCKASKCTYFTSMADIGGSMDILSSLRGAEQLLCDLIDYPEEVKKVNERIEELWKIVYSKLYAITSRYQNGMTSWMPIYCEKRYYPLQCDFCAMISPDMFLEFVKPNLSAQAEWLDHSIYHLDGMDAVRHLDHLLDIPAIDAIQWSAGAGKPPLYDECFFDMYNKISRSGKGLVLFSVPLTELENVLKNISTKGLFITMQVSDEKEALEAIKIAKSYGVK
ncbi:MAG TPA: hypothetical protein PK761_08460 [Clostridia bacterium]|nr:hypothetical protein [Clostridia bacterium]HPL08562.1 hypothetical protein [Clostridia bacterium]